MKSNCLQLAIFLLVLLAFQPINPAHSAFDFEDGSLDGWLEVTTGDSGSTGIAAHNGSEMAYAEHTGSYMHGLSRDYDYIPDNTLSFDMQAIANSGGRSTQAWAGVQVSFLDSFKSTLGSARLLNVTSGITLGDNDRGIDSTQHHYENTWADYASLAGLDPTDGNIDHISLLFYTEAQTNYPFGNRSYATVWFDNVEVEAVPIPSAFLLLGSGILGLGMLKRRGAR
jgi:hypothetical protein